MIQKNKAPTSWAGTGGADGRVAQKDNEPICILPKPAINGNQATQDEVYLDDLLTEFVALNYDRYFPESYPVKDPRGHPLWRQALKGVMRRAVLLVVRTDYTPDWLSDAVIDYAFQVHDGVPQR